VNHDESPSAEPAESAVTTRHVLDLPAGPLTYRATAGTMRVLRDDGSALADMFFLAYHGEPGTNYWGKSQPFGRDSQRPLTFAFNGGPGSASMRLNVGGFGPRRAPAKAPQPTPPAPYELGDNPYSLLPVTDLVFIDAPGTGFSRVADGARPEDTWGVDQDADIFARAITRYLTLSGSWQAPRYLFGESYGAARAAVLARVLQDQGLDINGVILLSAVLNRAAVQPGLDQGYVNLLPSYAAAARYHGKGSQHSASQDSAPQDSAPQDTAHDDGAPHDMVAFLAEARKFAATQYAQALQLGDTLPEAEEEAVAKQLSGYIGLDPSLLRRKRLRVEVEDFRRELLAEDGKVIGRLDARSTSPAGYALGGDAGDPATAGVNSAHLAGFHQHLARELSYLSDLDYRPLGNAAIECAWDWRHKAPGTDEPLPVPNVALDLAAAMRRNPALRVLVMGGVFDLASPFGGAEFDVSHLYLNSAHRKNVQFKWYKSGHMTFVDEEAIALMSGDLRGFYETP
jgi:carboxypeptidase C (cathepsin A)